VDDGVVTGVLTREHLLKALSDGRADDPVSEVMQRSFVAAAPDESLERALERLQTCRCRTLPVVQGRELVGMLTAEKISELVMIASATRSGESGH
jgi:CBS domain-containing protein